MEETMKNNMFRKGNNKGRGPYICDHLHISWIDWKFPKVGLDRYTKNTFTWSRLLLSLELQSDNDYYYYIVFGPSCTGTGHFWDQ